MKQTLLSHRRVHGAAVTKKYMRTSLELSWIFYCILSEWNTNFIIRLVATSLWNNEEMWPPML